MKNVILKQNEKNVGIINNVFAGPGFGNQK